MQYIALLVIAISLIAIAYRDLKSALIGLAIILVSVILFYYLSPDQDASVKRNAQLLTSLEMMESDITQGYADGFVLNLRVLNHDRKATVNTLTILSRLSDCVKGQSDCVVVGEDRNIVKLRIPPGQARDAKVNLRIKLLNPLQGDARWEHKIIGVK